MTGQALQSLIAFVAIIALIPVALWLLKRTPLGGAGGAAAGLRMVSALPLSASQRIVTVEVGQGDDRRWLVLGVTPSAITTLHTLPPQADPPAAPAAAHAGFAQLLDKLRGGGSRGG